MRCSICGTDNEADSRFCGGCGARVSGVSTRVAPTVKVLDDARYPQSEPSLVTEIVPGLTPGAPHPPTQLAAVAPIPRPRSSDIQRRLTPPSMPPPIASTHGRELRTTTSSDDARVPRARAWVGVVVLADVAIAVAGAWMLRAGLHTGEAVAAVAVTPARVVADAGVVAVVVPGHAKKAVTTASRPTVTPIIAGGSGSDADVPMAEVAEDLDRTAAASKTISDSCYRQATRSRPADQPLSGTLRVGLRVLPDGKISDVITVDNTTGSDQLATCMMAEVGSWVLHPHAGAPADLIKVFSFQARP